MKPLQTIQLSFKCPKAFDKLIPCQDGWYCEGCQKLVQDFRGTSESELRQIVAQSPQRICGLFETDCITIKPHQHRWQKWLSASIMALGLTGLPQTIFAQRPFHKDSVLIRKEPIANQQLVFGMVDEVAPEYPGGIEKFRAYVKSNLTLDADYTGKRVIVTFLVKADGSVADVKILRSQVSDNINQQLIRIFRASPKWKPGRIGNRSEVQNTVPIIF
ncbi:energy transducer TonB [Mucilaginibacter robiniae]|uniref:Energy transducer TonB n=1 Tax=Mucilaginibacter robiniae TaxID=2728022 RepID=A0A7L5E2R0_9SPHI|nr:energy transducer TonB [Mucilaginibacter robiniae]QJD95083.1 energy transducer TonB [Mucilaginibacter robiniae]